MVVSGKSKSSSFQSIQSITIPKRIILGVRGPEGSGKTMLGLSAAMHNKLFVQRFDTAASEGPISVVQAHGVENIVVSTYDFDVAKQYASDSLLKGGETDKEKRAKAKLAEDAQGEASVEFERFEKELTEAVKDHYDIMWDTGTEQWESLRLAEFGKSAQVPQMFYERANRRMMHNFNKVVFSPQSLIVIHEMSPKWVKDISGKSSKSNTYEPRGFERLCGTDVLAGYLPAVVVQTYRGGKVLDLREEPEDDGLFYFRILKCNTNGKADLVGQDIPIVDPLEGFNTLGQLIFEDEWGE